MPHRLSSGNGSDPDVGHLRQVLEAAGVRLTDGTVLAAANDPYRQDTPAGHRDGQWFAAQFQATGKDTIHLRGLHYAIVARGTVLKPNGLPYRNTEEDWNWLQEHASKAGRWLGYVPFAAIVDQRSADPVLYHAERDEYPSARVETEVPVYVPPRAAIAPTIHVQGFLRQQLYQLVIFGEKASLTESVLPIARTFGADAYLETGEISDSHLYLMARRNQDDGRPLRVFTVADFDPAGWQMSISIARKLQALRDLEFPDMDFEVHPVALLPEQVRDLELPSTPLKETERRADRWRERWSHEQTEIDALATLRPEVLTSLLHDALSSFYDWTLAHRLEQAKDAWLEEAHDELRAHIDQRAFRRLTKQADQALTTFRRQITRINTGLRRLTAGVVLPDIIVPDVRIDEDTQPDPLISSDWPWLEQTRALKARKAYE